MRSVNNRGFALLESIAAITIIGIVLVTALSSISAYLRAGKSAENLAYAAMIGQSELAGLLSGEIRATGSERAAEEFQGFTVTSSVEKLDAYISRLNVSVKWKEFGREKDSLFTTCIFRAGNEKRN